MILTAILNLLKVLILFILNLFPDLPDVQWLNNFVTDFVEVCSSVNRFVDLKTVSICFVLILIVYNARAIWSVVMWVIRKIPGVS